MSVPLFFALVIAVAAGRLVELGHSNRNRRRMRELGARRVEDPMYPAMVLLHVAYLIATPLEVVALERPFLAWLGIPALLVLVASNAFRYWVIHTLAVHWNTGVVDSQGLGVVTAGPYRWIRHPNYVAVFFEVLTLPLIHTAWLTALAATVVNVTMLGMRIQREERTLMESADYRREMGVKPRFLPRLHVVGRP